MSVRIGQYEFEHASYDDDVDVLYLRSGEVRAPAKTYETPEGHAVDFDETGTVIGMIIVNARWLAEQDGKITVTVPTVEESSADELAPALTAS